MQLAIHSIRYSSGGLAIEGLALALALALCIVVVVRNVVCDLALTTHKMCMYRGQREVTFVMISLDY